MGLEYEDNAHARSEWIKKKERERLPISGKLRTISKNIFWHGVYAC